MQPSIRLNGVSVTRKGVSILSEVSAELQAGDILGLLGPSGAGKTTLIRVVMGLQRVSGGTVEVFGRIPTEPAVRASVGYVTQAPSVYADLSVLENLRYFAGVIGASGRDVERVLSATDMLAKAHQLVGSLSGGQRGRVSLAAALLGEPKLLVLDEPTVGLDPVLRQELWNVFRGLAANGAAILISSHVMDEAERCDQLLLLRDGHALAAGTPAGLKERTGAKSVEGAFLDLVTSRL